MGSSRDGRDTSAPARAAAPAASAAQGLRAIERTVAGMGYELVDVERAPQGLLRVSIDRIPGHAYPVPEGEVVDPGVVGQSVTLADCERVTRQLQFVLEVEGVDYRRLEVASPGLDRPLRQEADFVRFAGQLVELTLREAFQGQRRWRGTLARSGEGWSLHLGDAGAERTLDFALDEVREARLVPVLDFKSRKKSGPQPATTTPAGQDGGQGR